MGRRARAAVMLLLGAALSTACGDPLIIVGDTPGFMRIVVGVGDSAGLAIGDLATHTPLMNPLSAAMDGATGDAIVIDQGATIIEHGISRRGARMFLIGSDNTIDAVFTDGGCSRGTCMREPVQMAFDADGSLLIADLLGNRLLRASDDLGELSVVAGSGRLDASPDGTPAEVAHLRGVGGVAVATDGRIYFSETGSHRIRTIASDGTLHTVAGAGSPGYTGDDGDPIAARLSSPRGLALHDGILYVADAGNHVVRAIDLVDATIGTVAGDGDAGYSGDGGSARAAKLNRPVSVTVAADGATLYIADEGNRRVRVVALAAGTIATFAGTGIDGFNGPGRAAAETHLRSPSAVAASGRGFLLIADREQHVVWRTSVRLQQ